MLAGLKIRSQDVLKLNAQKGKLQPPGQSGRWLRCSVVGVVGGRWSVVGDFETCWDIRADCIASSSAGKVQEKVKPT